jgi:hypothetical protein
MPMRNELAIPLPYAARRAEKAAPGWSRILQELGNPDLLAVLLVTAIGLFVTGWLALSLPLPHDLSNFAQFP